MSGTVGSTTATASTAATTGGNALGSLATNFSSFLNLLLTQLKNQDPTSPLDTNQFTTELVQFSGVEQQIATNTNLKQLVQISQAGQVIQSAAMLGHKVSASSDQLSLQSGKAEIRFDAPAAGQAEVVVSDSRGAQLYATAIDTAAGANAWTWDGRSQSGTTLPDGAYHVSVTPTGDGGGKPYALAVVGTVSALNQQGGGVEVELGALPVSFSAIKAVLD